mgnify:CR=1 FL=1|jgi:hypothetical protein
MFAPYKSRAKQQWINEIKTAVWKDGEKPRYTGSTTDPDMVGGSFVDLFKMIYGEKVIDENEAGRLLRRLKRSKITKASQEMMSAPVTSSEIKKVMIQLPALKAAGPNRIPNDDQSRPYHSAPRFTEVCDPAEARSHLERNGACTVGPGKVPHALRRHLYPAVHSSAVPLMPTRCAMGAEWVHAE